MNLILATTQDYVIGDGLTLPWGHIPEDMQFFKQTTFGKPVIMGRKTFESLPQILPGRPNIVLTRSKDFANPNVEVFNSLEAALEKWKQFDPFIIGGANLFSEALPLCDNVYITWIKGKYEGDVKLTQNFIMNLNTLFEKKDKLFENSKIEINKYQRNNNGNSVCS